MDKVLILALVVMVAFSLTFIIGCHEKKEYKYEERSVGDGLGHHGKKVETKVEKKETKVYSY